MASLIKSKEHFLIKKRIFDRLMGMCYEGDCVACVDAWNLSYEMIKFLDTVDDEFIRENSKCWLIEKRKHILEIVDENTLFELKVYL